MKKIIAFIISSIMIIMMSGCKAEVQDGNQIVSTPNPTSTIIPTEAITQPPVEKLQLQPGFDAWEETEAVRALNQVLTMDMPVKVITAQEGITGSNAIDEYYLNDIKHFIVYDFEQSMVPDSYAVVDLDGDSIPEVVVSLRTGNNNWILILRYYEGSVYGHSFVYRAFESPKVDGTFMASSGAQDNSIMELSFDGYDIEEKILGFSISLNDGVEYYIADSKVSEKEFYDFTDEFVDKEGVRWYLFPSNLRAGYTGEELFHVNFDAITEPTSMDLESYYSEMETSFVFSNSSQIPRELCDLIIDAMRSGNEEETFGSIKTGEELSQEEFCNLTGFEADEFGFVTPVRVDADNDGKQDLVALYYWGGTGGFSSMEFFKGSDDGKYESTQSFDCILQEYKIISFQGKNYLLMKNTDYNTKYYSGYSLYLYENGTLADGVKFWFDIKDYEMEIISENSSFSGIEQIKQTLSNKELPKVLVNNDGVINGTGEIIDNTNNADYQYSSDIDNDGTPEYYNKYMWYPSNMGTVMQCMYDFEESYVFEDLSARLDEKIGEGRLYTFWIDKINNENILYLYYGNNLDYSLYAYRLMGVE